MNYAKIKTMLQNGETPTVGQLSAAIESQTVVVAQAAASLAKHASKLLAAGGHPFPLPEDQEGRVGRRFARHEHEMARLVRLFTWRELTELAPVTAPGHSA